MIGGVSSSLGRLPAGFPTSDPITGLRSNFCGVVERGVLLDSTTESRKPTGDLALLSLVSGCGGGASSPTGDTLVDLFFSAALPSLSKDGALTVEKPFSIASESILRSSSISGSWLTPSQTKGGWLVSSRLGTRRSSRTSRISSFLVTRSISSSAARSTPENSSSRPSIALARSITILLGEAVATQIV